MSLWSALVGGFAGTVVLTAILAAASHLHLTRMDIPFLLGTACTADRSRAQVIFAVIYAAAFAALGRAGWTLGLVFGLAHAAFAGTALVNVLLPAVHPRMGTPVSAADSTPLLEPPGFMLLNYGRATPAVTVLAHLAYGAIVGWFLGAAAGA
jgi:hypothetical protein